MKVLVSLFFVTVQYWFFFFLSLRSNIMERKLKFIYNLQVSKIEQKVN